MEIPMNNQKGFTLIELVAVIVILGALAVTAVPQFINLQDEANEAAVKGVAGALGSDAAVNLAGALAGDNSAAAATACGDFDIQQGISAPYSIVSATTASAGTGDAFTCKVANKDADVTATFQGYAVPNAP
jgi:MSHA pilin protein MshA